MVCVDMKNVWYKITIDGGTYEMPIGFTEDPNVYMWFVRNFGVDIFVVEKYYIETEDELDELIRELSGCLTTLNDNFILDMVYADDKSAPMFRYVDEEFIDYIVEDKLSALSAVLKFMCAALGFIRFDNFDVSIARDVKNTIRYLGEHFLQEEKK